MAGQQKVSKFHREVRAWLDAYTPKFITVKGWPDSEVNLAKLAGMTGKASFADFWLEDNTSGRAMVLEVHSTLHNEKGYGAWGGGADEHYTRLGNDDAKKQICAQIGVPIVEIWPPSAKGSSLNLTMLKVMESFMQIATIPDVKEDVSENVSSKCTLNGRPGVTWERRPLESSGTHFQSGQKLGGGQQKLTGGGKLGGTSSFGKGRSLGARQRD